ncbi:adenylyl-sulfate kinase [Arenimonas maotaiensis]|uniref:Multifunctional fusion protein n=1 Tax=Arenimonas maotaiensis TaxID=1446479 RepID=A0A917FHX8_9GAMM|nr:sulfate adenylyltransferase subunit CysN [Arenimonas maotaiensis]GGF86063.1 adenylyl-sulfate kinase [Arenimonas maotaiensis]
MAADIRDYLQRHETKSLLRFITCGSVDDGKSTLIGRLLHDTKGLFDDQLAALEKDSAKHGTQGDAVDFALLVDGLAAEREQGITIDVAYRFFATDRRKFIVADCPGHEQYTRNMATGASTADVAVVLIDARKGVLTQTRRHSFIVSLLGIRHVLLAVNKMDLVGFDEGVFNAIVEDYHALADQLGIANVQAVPLSALGGDNLAARSLHTPWYGGPTVLEYLETVETASTGSAVGADTKMRVEPVETRTDIPGRLPVQWVCRPNLDFRGFAGTVCAGAFRPGDAVVALPSGKRSRIARIVSADGDLPQAVSGQAITLTLADELDISRGDVIAAAHNPPETADQFAAHLVWMDEAELIPGRGYWLKIGTRTVNATVTEIKHRIDINSQEPLAAKTLHLNEIGVCNLKLDRAIAFEPYALDRTLGGFILIDRQSNATVAAGTLDFALRRAGNIHWQSLDVDRAARAALKAQTPRCIWFTGLSGSGKSTLANRLEQRLLAAHHHTYLLDGDNVRHGLNKDLGFTEADRVENIRRVAEVARLMVDAGLIVLVSFISPYRAERAMARSLFGDDGFIEVFVDTPIELCEQRDVKGLYAKARRGELPNFTGISSPYEAPENPELHLRTAEQDIDAMVDAILKRIG